MSRRPLLLLALLGATACLWPPPNALSADAVCLALGFGRWDKEYSYNRVPDSWLETPPHLQLLMQRPKYDVPYDMRLSGPDTSWRIAAWHRAPSAPAGSSNLFLDGWRSSGDSVELIRLCGLCSQLRVVGTWHAGTIRAGAARITSDGGGPVPKATVYGVRYQCTDTSAAAAADGAIRRMRANSS